MCKVITINIRSMSSEDIPKFKFSIDKILEPEPTHSIKSDNKLSTYITADEGPEEPTLLSQGRFFRDNLMETQQAHAELISLNNMYEHRTAFQKMFNIQNAFSLCFSQYDRYNLQMDIKGRQNNVDFCYGGLPGFYISEFGTKRKGGQIRFTSHQTKNLEHRFLSSKYLSPEERKHLANQLKLSDRQVKTWFQNRRAKWRRCQSKSSGGQTQDSNENS